MTVNELIEELNNLKESGYGETDVVMAYQPNYPMATDIDVVTGFNGHHKDRETEEEDEEKSESPCVFIATAENNNYCCKYAWSGNVDTLDDEDYAEPEEDD